MRLRLKKSTTFISVGISAFSMIVLSGAIFFATKATPVRAQSTNDTLVTIYDRGMQSTFVTGKATIQEALDAAGIELDERDAVEPARDEKLIAEEYQVNIYRARPVTVVDGATRQRVVTPYQSAERIAKDAGVSLFAEDTTSLVRSHDFIGEGAGLQMIVDRATPLNLDLFGSTSTVRTQAETVGEMMKEKGITLDKDSRVAPSASTPITEGMSIRIWKEGIQTVTVDEEVAFDTEQIKDADRPIGYKEVKTAGIVGSRSVTYEVVIQNGVEVERKEIASVVKTEPVKQVEVIGAKSPTLPYTGGGTKTEWLAASGIPSESWGYADFMVAKESGWNPNAVNKSSGACGLAQALPCSKLGPNWSNPVVALNWMNSYVNGRYYDGSPYAKGLCGGMTSNWQCAHAHWTKYRWY